MNGMCIQSGVIDDLHMFMFVRSLWLVYYQNTATLSVVYKSNNVLSYRIGMLSKYITCF